MNLEDINNGRKQIHNNINNIAETKRQEIQSAFGHNITKIEHPDKVVNQMLNLFENSETALTVREGIKKDGVKLYMGKKTSHGYSTKGAIILGEKKIDADFKGLFLMKLTDGEAKAYELIHEMSHQIVFFMRENGNLFGGFEGLHTTLKQIRETYKVGLSKLGSDAFYENRTAASRAGEDLSELIAKYIVNPKMLKNYLKYLSETESQQLAENGLKKISKDVGDKIYKQIECFVEKYIELRNF
ncbi:MAG: hypothetical protein WCO66_01315 [Candidatus Absconditabacteria bacterium]